MIQRETFALLKILLLIEDINTCYILCVINIRIVK